MRARGVGGFRHGELQDSTPSAGARRAEDLAPRRNLLLSPRETDRMPPLLRLPRASSWRRAVASAGPPRATRCLRIRDRLPRHGSAPATARAAPRLRPGRAIIQYPCTRTTEVWAEIPLRYVAIRDLKMCGCPDGFVPRSRHAAPTPVMGAGGPAAGPARPSGSFGWDVGAQSAFRRSGRSPLLINPPALRTQDQLHIHLVRLPSPARGARIDALRGRTA